MRTTLDLEEDVLLAAKDIARRRGVSIGKAVSDLARQALLVSEHGGCMIPQGATGESAMLVRLLA